MTTQTFARGMWGKIAHFVRRSLDTTLTPLDSGAGCRDPVKLESASGFGRIERTERAMASAHDVAAYILSRQSPMTAMKLQKLVYYTQAWHMVRSEQQMFQEPIEAWAAGPVIRSLYDKHRGRYMLSPHDGVGGDVSKLTDQEKRSIDVVLGHYGSWTAEELSELSHSEPPWKIARSGLSDTERGDRQIDPSDMLEYYSSLARKSKVQSPK